MFLNSILTNADIWVGLTKSEIEEFENLDLMLLRKFVNTPFSVPAEAVYLELGCLNVETIIKARRIIYLHYLLKQEDSSMMSKFFMAQWTYPARKNEWTEQVKSDLNDFGLSLDLDILKNISINSFKSQVKKKAKEYAFYTFLEKQQSHSKLDNLSYSGLRLQKYLNLENMTNLEAQTVFSYRTRMSDYGENYRGVTGPSVCPLCHNHPDSQKWSYECKVINKNVLIKGRYSNIFSDNIENETVQTIIKITKFRKDYLYERQLR